MTFSVSESWATFKLVFDTGSSTTWVHRDFAPHWMRELTTEGEFGVKYFGGATASSATGALVKNVETRVGAQTFVGDLGLAEKTQMVWDGVLGLSPGFAMFSAVRSVGFLVRPSKTNFRLPRNGIVDVMSSEEEQHDKEQMRCGQARASIAQFGVHPTSSDEHWMTQVKVLKNGQVLVQEGFVVWDSGAPGSVIRKNSLQEFEADDALTLVGEIGEITFRFGVAKLGRLRA